jgi:hypothetical protein
LHKDTDILLNLFVQNDGPPGRQKGGQMTALDVVGIVFVKVDDDFGGNGVHHFPSIIIYDIRRLIYCGRLREYISYGFHRSVQAGVSGNVDGGTISALNVEIVRASRHRIFPLFLFCWGVPLL